MQRTWSTMSCWALQDAEGGAAMDTDTAAASAPTAAPGADAAGGAAPMETEEVEPLKPLRYPSVPARLPGTGQSTSVHLAVLAAAVPLPAFIALAYSGHRAGDS